MLSSRKAMTLSKNSKLVKKNWTKMRFNEWKQKARFTNNMKSIPLLLKHEMYCPCLKVTCAKGSMFLPCVQHALQTSAQ